MTAMQHPSASAGVFERIAHEAVDAARHYSTHVEACPYPFGTAAARVFCDLFDQARASASTSPDTMLDSYLQTAGGRDYALGGMASYKFDEVGATIEDVAHHLAQINRFTGAAVRPYSVAEHSLLVADISRTLPVWSPIVELAALLHDAHEAYVGDVASPAKVALGVSWLDFENRHALRVRETFGVTATLAGKTWTGRLIAHCDRVALATERRDLLPRFDSLRSLPWPVIDGDSENPPVRPADVTLPTADRCWRDLRDAFLDRFHTLRSQVDAKAANLRGEPSELSA